MRVLRISHSAVVGAWRERERGLIAAGIDVQLICARAWNEGGELVTIETADTLGTAAEDFVHGLRTVGNRPNVFLFDPRPVWKLLAQPFDLVDIHEEPCALVTWQIRLLMRLRGHRAPLVLYSAQNIDKRYPIPFRWIERSSLRRAAAVSVCNVEAGRIVRRKGFRGLVSVIGLGVDTGQFSPADRTAPDGRLRIGYFGRLLPHKGVRTAIEAMQGAPELDLRIFGAGPQEQELHALVGSLGLQEQVSFEGFLPTESLPERYREVDVTVVPSVPTGRWQEQFGRVVIESMAAGVPVVASRSGALTEVVGDAGVLVPPGDPAALRQALLDLAADPARWTRLREAGQRRAGEFGWPRIAADYVQLYRSVLDGPVVGGTAFDGTVLGGTVLGGTVLGGTAFDGTAFDGTVLGGTVVDGRMFGGGLEREMSEPVTAPGLTVIVVAYGSPELLADCLAPLAGQFPVVVVDNSSLPETRQLAIELGARYLDPGRNLGFGAAVNRALPEVAAGHDVVLLNPDAVVTITALQSLLRALRQDPRLAAVGPAQTDPETGTAARVGWPFPTPTLAWVQALGLGRLYRNRAGFVIGSVLAIKAAALADVGGFDERFFLYAEETDWQRRATQLGWRVRVVPEVTAQHIGAGTGGDASLRETFFHASHELYVRKYFGPEGWLAYRAAVIAGGLVRAAVLRGPARNKARFRLRLYLTGPLRAQREAELRARRAAELRVLSDADLRVLRDADLGVEHTADLRAQGEAERAHREADLHAVHEAELRVQRDAEQRMAGTGA